jgi:hypothetical protein
VMAGSTVGPGAGEAETAEDGAAAGVGDPEPAANAGRVDPTQEDVSAIKATLARNAFAIISSYPARNDRNRCPSLGA